MDDRSNSIRQEQTFHARSPVPSVGNLLGIIKPMVSTIGFDGVS
jgi:hypothetical protein